MEASLGLMRVVLSNGGKGLGLTVVGSWPNEGGVSWSNGGRGFSLMVLGGFGLMEMGFLV